MSAEVHSVAYDQQVVKRLLERMLELEQNKSPDEPAEAQYGEHSNQTDNRRAGNVNTATITEHSKLLPWLMMCALFAGFSLAASVAAIIWTTTIRDDLTREFQRVEREAKQLQIQVMDQNALNIRNGWVHPGDEVYGPAGNLEYKPREQRR